MDCYISESDPLVKVTNINSTLILVPLQYVPLCNFFLVLFNCLFYENRDLITFLVDGHKTNTIEVFLKCLQGSKVPRRTR